LDNLTLVLLGDVSLASFDTAVRRFHGLLTGLAREIASSPVDWVVDDLEPGSARISVLASPETDREDADRIVRAFADVGESIGEGREILYSPRVVRDANALVALLNGQVTALQFETPETVALVTTGDGQGGERQPRTSSAFGGVRGRVQTLSSRGTLRFTLYDDLEDKAVSCYLDEGQEEMIRGVWGKPAIVEGWVTRDRSTGRPLTVRRVSRVVVLEEVALGSWRALQGLSPPLSPISAEEAIRRMRDAS
jgi:hypothetical protein